MKCFSCGKAVPSKTKFCAFCGENLFTHCPCCNKLVEASISICPFCNIDFSIYGKALRLLEEGEKLEREYNYKDAISRYEIILEPHTLKQEAEKRIQVLKERVETLAEKRVLGEKSLKTGSIKAAKKSFLEIQKIIPTDEHANKALSELTPLLRKKALKVWFLSIGVLVIAGIVGWKEHRNTLSFRAKEELASLLDSQNLDIRNSSAYILAVHGKQEGVHTLRILINSNDERKRLYALTALLPFAEKQAISGLRELLYNGSVPAKIGAGWALVNHGDTLSAVRLGIDLSSNDEDLRIADAVLLFNLGYSEGLPIIEEGLESSSPDIRFKTLYALYLLGDKEMLSTHIGEWAGKAKKLLKDESEDVKLITAFLLNKIHTNLTVKDSTLIECILWNGFLRSKDKETPKLKDLPEVQAFYLAKDVINNEGDEELTHFTPSAREIRQTCQSELSKIELGDKFAIETAKSRMDSKEPLEQLYGAIVGYKVDKRKAGNVLKRLMSASDEKLKLLTCKMLYEFIIRNKN